MSKYMIATLSLFILAACAEPKNIQANKPTSSQLEKEKEKEKSKTKPSPDCQKLEQPQQRAECVVVAAFKNGTNEAINKKSQGLINEGFKASEEFESIYVGGFCDEENDCYLNYVVSTEYFTEKGHSTTILVEVKAVIGADASTSILKIVELK